MIVSAVSFHMSRRHPIPFPYLLLILTSRTHSAKIVSPDDPFEVLPIGQRGELAVSGYNVQKGYWGDPERTAEVMIPDSMGKVWMHVSTAPTLSHTVAHV